MRAGAAHADRVPGLHDRHALGIHRHAELQHRRPVLRIVLDRAGHEQLRRRRAARERLAGVDLVAALDLLGLAGSFQPVRSARRQKLDALGGDALEQAVGRRLLMRPTPGRGRRRVGVHRQRQRGRRAIVRQRAQHRGGLGARQSGPAEFGRNRQREEFALPQQLEIGGGEFVRLVAAAPFLGELRADLVERRPPVEGGRVDGPEGKSGSHGIISLFLICSTPRGDRSLRPPKSDHKAGGLFG